MSTCRGDYPKIKPKQDSCSYCDEFMGCCPSGADHVVPFMRMSKHFPFPAGTNVTNVGPNPYANLTKHYRNQTDDSKDWVEVCFGEWWDPPNYEEPSHPDSWYLTKRADNAYYLYQWRAMFPDQYMRLNTDAWPQREVLLRKMRKWWEDDEQRAEREAPFDESKWDELTRTKFPEEEEIVERWCKPSAWCAPKT